ncbi:MAG: protease inhibitor I42 family protein [Phycisphaerales bacterium]|nr:protease inhibitor I42 family protein [Phycisphaerales bacterium]
MLLMPKLRPFLLAPFAWVLLALILLLATGCSSSPPEEPAVVPAGTRENGMLVLTQADNQRTAEIRVGEQIVVRLPESRTTGYVWAIDETNRQLLALDGTRFEEPKEGFIGARGTRSYTLSARQAGKVDLKLKYWRIWEGEGSVSERFSVTLLIQDK